MKFIKDYDCTILYHLRKANVVTYALSKKSISSLANIAKVKRLLINEIHELESSGI